MSENEHLHAEMQRAISEGDSIRAEQLDGLVSTSEFEGSLDTVNASEALRQRVGVEKCLVIHQLPNNVNTSQRLREFSEYLMRVAQRENAINVSLDDYQTEYVAVIFPGRPEEIYSPAAFLASLRELLRKKQDK